MKRTISVMIQDPWDDIPVAGVIPADDVRAVMEDAYNPKRCRVTLAGVKEEIVVWCLPQTMVDAAYRMDVSSVVLSSTHENEAATLAPS